MSRRSSTSARPQGPTAEQLQAVSLLATVVDDCNLANADLSVLVSDATALSHEARKIEQLSASAAVLRNSDPVLRHVQDVAAAAVKVDGNIAAMLESAEAQYKVFMYEEATEAANNAAQLCRSKGITETFAAAIDAQLRREREGCEQEVRDRQEEIADLEKKLAEVEEAVKKTTLEIKAANKATEAVEHACDSKMTELDEDFMHIYDAMQAEFGALEHDAWVKKKLIERELWNKDSAAREKNDELRSKCLQNADIRAYTQLHHEIMQELTGKVQQLENRMAGAVAVNERRVVGSRAAGVGDGASTHVSRDVSPQSKVSGEPAGDSSPIGDAVAELAIVYPRKRRDHPKATLQCNSALATNPRKVDCIGRLPVAATRPTGLTTTILHAALDIPQADVALEVVVEYEE